MEDKKLTMEDLNEMDLTQMTQEELIEKAQAAIELAKEKDAEFAKYRSDSEKGVKKLLEKQKKQQEDKDPETDADDEGGTSDAEIDKVVELKMQQREVRGIIENFKSNLPADLQEQFQENFEDLTKSAELNPTNVQKYLKATAGLLSDGDDKVAEQLRAMAIGGRPSSAPQKDAKQREFDRRREETRKFLQSN